MADVYIVMLKDMSEGLDKQIDSKELEVMREVFITDTRAKRAFGRGKGRGKSKGREKANEKDPQKDLQKEKEKVAEGVGDHVVAQKDHNPERVVTRITNLVKRSSTKRCLISRTI